MKTYPPGLRLVLNGLKRGYTADPGSLNPGIPSRKHLWAAQAKVCRAIVKYTQRKRLQRWSHNGKDTAPAAAVTDRYALLTNPVENTALRMRALGTGNGGTPSSPS